jgi:dethiobiotin synthetase
MRVIFVSGTDTGVGKTVVTGLLSRYLLEKGYKVATQKWIQSGSGSDIGDVARHLKFMGKTKEDFKGYYPLMIPYTFQFAASAHLAAKLEGEKISLNKIKRSLKTLAGYFDFIIVEGLGGLAVPVDEKKLLIDIIKKFKIPVLITAANKLGAINHTLLSLEALQRRKIKILGIIFNNISKKENKIILKDNPKIVEKLSKGMVLGTLPWKKNPKQLQKQFRPLGNKILAHF